MIESNDDGRRRWNASLMNNYGTPERTLVRGEGAQVWDADGARYLDLLGGIAVNALGHAHPAVLAAVTEQVGVLGHTSNLYGNGPTIELAEALLARAGVAGGGKVVFCNSGAEANETAFKLARLTGRSKVVAFEGAFHGRTMGSLALTGQPGKREPFEPVTPGVTHVPFGDVAALESIVDSDTAAVFLEPVLGEAGVVPAPDGYLAAAREITERHGALLVLDEVQTGIGRLGSWFGYQRAGIIPDLITLAKGLGGGLPLAAVIGVGAAGELFRPGQHGTTFGGNPVCAAAGLAVLATIDSEGLLEHTTLLGKELAAAVTATGHPMVETVRGAGLLLGIGLRAPIAKQVVAAAASAGYLVNAVSADTVRLAPPLVLDQGHAREFAAALPAVLDAAAAASKSGGA